MSAIPRAFNRVFLITSAIFCLFYGKHLAAQHNPADYITKPKPIIQFNDGYQNLNPVVSDDGKQIWFSKLGHPSNVGKKDDKDIWSADLEGNKFTMASNQLFGLNTELNDLVIGQAANDIIYVLQYKQGIDEHLSVISAFKAGPSSYQLDHVIKIPKLKFYSEFFGFHISSDEKVILISMKGDESYGKEDLYVLLNDGQTWSEPRHLGARVNTSGFEMSPYLSRDKKQLFFASDGHDGFGSSDIFVTSRLDDSWQNWSRPINLGPNINSPRFEAYFSLSESNEQAYYVSNSDGLTGGMYQIKYRSSISDQSTAHPMATGFIRMEKLPAMNVELSLLDENDRVVQNVKTNDQGYFDLQSFLPDRDYRIAIKDSIRQGLVDADIYLTNTLGDGMVFMNEGELGMFGFKVLSGERIDQVEELEQKANKGKIVDKPTQITGKVAAFGTINEKVKLNVIDQNSNVIEQIETDEDGYFSFSTNAKEKRYFLSVDEKTHGLVDVYEIFLTNDNPNEDIIVSKTDKHLFEFITLRDASTAGLKKLKEVDRGISPVILSKYAYEYSKDDKAITGFLKMGKLPLINTTITLVDEMDNEISRSITDGAGRFVFDTALDTGNYKLLLDDQQKEVLDEREIFLARNPQDVVFYLNDDRAGMFAFKKLSKNEPYSLYSLTQETEKGKVVNNQVSTLKGKFQYSTLPKEGVRLKLMDESEAVVQITEIDENGNFEFKNFSTNKNYFIAVEANSGLSDIYEIYLSGQQKNVLVNNTNRFVFAFSVLPSMDVVLSESYENDSPLGEADKLKPRFAFDMEDDTPYKSYYELDLYTLKREQYKSLTPVVNSSKEGFQVTVRLSKENRENDSLDLEPIPTEDIESVIKAFVAKGIDPNKISYQRNGSDQALIYLM